MMETENKVTKDYIWAGIVSLIAMLVLGVIYGFIRKRRMM